MRRRSRKRQAEVDARPALATVSDERAAIVGAADPNFREFIRRLPCVVCLAPTLGSDPCHWRAKRRFGDWLEVEGAVQGNLWPACRWHHREQHDHGVETFQADHGLNLRLVCAIIGECYLRGWSAEGLGAVARGGYTTVDPSAVVCGGLPE